MTHLITSDEIEILLTKLDAIRANADALHQKLFEANRKNEALEARIKELEGDLNDMAKYR